MICRSQVRRLALECHSIRASSRFTQSYHKPTTHLHSENRGTSDVAFAFDIDGVLFRGDEIIPGATRALRLLEGDNPLSRKFPYIFITNGGGITESERSSHLTERLGIKISPSQILQSHTVLRDVVPRYRNIPILAVGGYKDNVRRVAHSYGFRDVYIPMDFFAHDRGIWPWLGDRKESYARITDIEEVDLRAILVFHDSRDWGLDIQVMCDVLRRQLNFSDTANESASRIELVFCNPDLLWRAKYQSPRFGQGAFREAFQGVFTALMGQEYPYTQLGKPHQVTFDYAERMLSSRLVAQGGEANEPLPTVYMIGDNPESDIAGAVKHAWSSILVRTGVYDPSKGPPTHTPTHEAGDVEEAVRWALKRHCAMDV